MKNTDCKVIKSGKISFGDEKIEYQVLELPDDDPSGCKYALEHNGSEYAGDEFGDEDKWTGVALDEIPDNEKIEQLIVGCDFG